MENISNSLSNFLGGGMLLLVGLILRFVKGSESLIAGYNMMNKAEQEKWNAVEMRLFLGKVLIVTSCVLLVGGILALLGFYPDLAVRVSWGLFIALILYCLFYMNASRRFKA